FISKVWALSIEKLNLYQAKRKIHIPRILKIKMTIVFLLDMISKVISNTNLIYLSYLDYDINQLSYYSFLSSIIVISGLIPNLPRNLSHPNPLLTYSNCLFCSYMSDQCLYWYCIGLHSIFFKLKAACIPFVCPEGVKKMFVCSI